MKRYLSILLVVVMMLSIFSCIGTSAYGWDSPEIMTVDEALEMYELEFGERPETYRYYFLMPNGRNGDKGDTFESGYYDKYAPSWYTELPDGTPATNTAGIYWWGSGVADPVAWCGYIPSGAEECDSDIFYADVPTDVTTIIWNNAVDGGMDPDDPIYYCAAQSINIPCEYYDAGESDYYPDGTENFNNMIFVVDPDVVDIAELSEKQTCGGEWYYYYGNGCYGFTKDGNETNCLRDDHFDSNGNHIGKETPTVKPTSAPTQAESDNTTINSEYVIAGPEYTDPSKINGQVHGTMGDADGDNEISIMDATEIQLEISRLISMNEICLLLADADGDQEVSILDATEIQLYVAQFSTNGVVGRYLYTPQQIEPTEPPTNPPTEVPTLYDGVQYRHTVPASGRLQYKFFASQSGYYVFSSHAGRSVDTWCKMYDSDFNEIEPEWYEDDYDDMFFDYNFYLRHYFEYGRTYYFEVGGNNISGKECPVRFEFLYSQEPTETVPPTETPDPEPTEPDYDLTDVQGGSLYDGYDANISIPSFTRKVMTFTPSTSGYYTIESDSVSGDPKVELYDMYGYLLDSNDDYDIDIKGSDFVLTYYLTAGQTYYYKIREYYGNSSISLRLKLYQGEYCEEPVYTETGVLNFDAVTSGWYGFKKLYCHLWVYGGDSFYAWHSKAEACTDADKDGIWTYDLAAKGIELEVGRMYGVIFSNEYGTQTYNLLLDSTVLGDTAFCDGTYFENPEDCSKTALAAFWRYQDAAEFGPEKCVTSIGNVVGTCVPQTRTAQGMFEDFLKEKLENARVYSDKNDQQLLDDTARALGLTKSDVVEAIRNTRVSVMWNEAYSTLSGGSDIPVNPNPSNPTQAFDAIKNYLGNDVVWDYDYDIDYEIEVFYNSDNNSIEIFGVDYSSSRVVRTYIRIMRGQTVFYYETEMDNDITGAVYFDATGYGSVASTRPLSFYTNKATFSSSSYTYSQAEPIITDGFAKALAVADYALAGRVNCSIYDLL